MRINNKIIQVPCKYQLAFAVKRINQFILIVWDNFIRENKNLYTLKT